MLLLCWKKCYKPVPEIIQNRFGTIGMSVHAKFPYYSFRCCSALICLWIIWGLLKGVLSFLSIKSMSPQRECRECVLPNEKCRMYLWTNKNKTPRRRWIGLSQSINAMATWLCVSPWRFFLFDFIFWNLKKTNTRSEHKKKLLVTQLVLDCISTSNFPHSLSFLNKWNTKLSIESESSIFRSMQSVTCYVSKLALLSGRAYTQYSMWIDCFAVYWHDEFRLSPNEHL